MFPSCGIRAITRIHISVDMFCHYDHHYQRSTAGWDDQRISLNI
jgi:hypothetical protein